MSTTARGLAAALGLLALAACGTPPAPPSEDVETQPATRVNETYPPDVAARLDSGNVAYSSGRYEEALRLYQAAAEAGPTIPSTWFGVYMAHHALGNLEAADSALQRARDVAPGAAAMLQPAPPDTTQP